MASIAIGDFNLDLHGQHGGTASFDPENLDGDPMMTNSSLTKRYMGALYNPSVAQTDGKAFALKRYVVDSAGSKLGFTDHHPIAVRFLYKPVAESEKKKRKHSDDEESSKPASDANQNSVPMEIG